jgi:hypothetical protein
MKEIITVNENPLDNISDKLLEIHAELEQIYLFDRNSITPEFIDKLHESLDNLSEEARTIGQPAKAEALKKISLQFYLLNTVGISDIPEKFSSESAHAFDMLELLLLALDGESPKNNGIILNRIETRNYQE